MHSLSTGSVIPPYTLKVSARRRTLGLRIDHRGLTVHVPKRLPKYILEQFLREKADWITRKLKEWEGRSAEAPIATSLENGALLRYLGNPITLSLSTGKPSRSAVLEGGRLCLSLPASVDTATVRRKLVQWYAKQARADFERRIALLAAKLGVVTPPLFLSSAKTRWGSCNSRGEIRLNWRLIQAPPHIIHYVVAHEMAHLKEMNHSAKFWSWVEKLCPDYLVAKQELKALSAQLHLI